MKQYDLSRLQIIFSAGERLDAPTEAWLADCSGKPVVDHWWQTETGWAITANLRGVEAMPIKMGSSTKPVPGFNVQILDEHGERQPAGTQGYIALKLPLPPACLNHVWGDENRFRAGYLTFLPGYYTSGDGGYIDEDGYVFVMGRVDDVINVAGHRLSTGEIEEVIATHPAVAECAVIACYDELKGQKPMGMVVLKTGETITEIELQQQLVKLVRDTIGAITCYKETVVLARLPKTRSGKTLRKTLCNIVNGREYTVPSTIDDASVIPEIIEVLHRYGIVA
jgi:propionyl-CoA synthetase